MAGAIEECTSRSVVVAVQADFNLGKERTRTEVND